MYLSLDKRLCLTDDLAVTAADLILFSSTLHDFALAGIVACTSLYSEIISILTKPCLVNLLLHGHRHRIHTGQSTRRGWDGCPYRLCVCAFLTLSKTKVRNPVEGLETFRWRLPSHNQASSPRTKHLGISMTEAHFRTSLALNCRSRKLRQSHCYQLENGCEPQCAI